MADKLDRAHEAIGNMTVLELKELLDAFEEKFEVTAAAPVAVAAAVAREEMADDLELVLLSAGSQKIQVIKTVHELTGLGLTEAKDLTEAEGAVVLAGERSVVLDAADRLKKAGASVEVHEVGRGGQDTAAHGTASAFFPWVDSVRRNAAADLIAGHIDSASGTRELDFEALRSVAAAVADVVGRPPSGRSTNE